ncbi:hypothetical protein EFB08_16535 [Rufibacter latericius]|uniref:PKD domain-containing protein n=1 Tax=Rufibacter latericius TaxID=2487040 RepID=A0A3M9MG50_9BACT|nr:hypothetical protein EFB08_16535 [Rufibacter latericius]
MTLVLLGLFTSCEEKPEDAPTPHIIAPVAHAGKDTTLLVPFSTINLTGEGSTDPDSNIVSYTWVKISGPSSVDITNFQSMRAFASNLVNVGTYEFELTVTDADKLFSKDTVKVTVAVPPCTSTTKEVILKDLIWTQPWLTEIQIENPHAYLPPNSYITNFYIKRDSSDKWELIIPLNHNSPDYGLFHEWTYGNKMLVIWPGLNTEDDTPDLKIEYCQ